MKSQEDMILEMLRAGEYVTPTTMRERTGSEAGHSRIDALRKRVRAEGFSIPCTMQYQGRKKWGSYRLVKDTIQDGIDRARS